MIEIKPRKRKQKERSFNEYIKDWALNFNRMGAAPPPSSLINIFGLWEKKWLFWVY
jgi:hypothetical protein